MSWPRTYSGGGQIPPQGGQSNLPNQLVQMMQMQLQMQHNIQLQKQQQFNPPKPQSRDNQTASNGSNKVITNVSNAPGSQTSIKSEKKNPAVSGEDLKKGTVNNKPAEQSKNVIESSDSAKQQFNKSHTNVKGNQNGTNSQSNQSPSKGKPSEPKVKIEPPSPQTPRQVSAKGSLLGSAPSALLPNPPPPPPPQEHGEKDSFSNEPHSQNAQDYNSNTGNQSNRSSRPNYNNDRQNQNNDYYQGGSGPQGRSGHQGGTEHQGRGGHQSGTEHQGRGGHHGGTEPQGRGGHQGGTEPQGRGGHQGGTEPQGRGGHQGGTEHQGGGGRWQSQQNSSRPAPQKDWQTPPNTARSAPQKDWQNQQNSARSSSQKDWQNQPDTKNFNAYQETSSDYNKGAASGSSYQNNMSDYNQHSRHSRNTGSSGDRSGRPGPQPYVKREQRGGGYYNPGGRLKDLVKMAFPGPMTNLEALDTAEKKFNAFSKVFVGNIPKNVEEEELLSLFNTYGEIGTTYINKDSSFGFLTFDYKANAAKAVREVDNKTLKNRYLKVRFAMINEGIRVRNLSPYISNELLDKAFSVFGTIESCRVLVDDRGNPKFEGIVIFKEKRSAALALKTCQEECFYLSGAMRPVVATPLEPCEDNVESYPETIIPQNDEYMEERKVPPHIADQTSFEFEFGNQWKKLFAMYDEKKNILDQDFKIELERLEKKMVLAKVEYETEKLRKELAEREAETAQLRRHFGADEFGARAASPAPYSAMGSAANDYEGGYGAIDQGYEAGYDAQYSEGYGNVAAYNKASDHVASSGADFDRGYGQQVASSYGGGYGREDYGRDTAAVGYGVESKYERGYGSAVSDIAVPPDLKRPSVPAPAPRQKYDSIPEPPSFKADPDTSLTKDPYQTASKRPRY